MNESITEQEINQLLAKAKDLRARIDGLCCSAEKYGLDETILILSDPENSFSDEWLGETDALLDHFERFYIVPYQTKDPAYAAALGFEYSGPHV